MDVRMRRHSAIRALIEQSGISSQDELRRKLAVQGFEVTQATLSRDVHDLNLSKGSTGYSLARTRGTAELKPTLSELVKGFGAQVRQALNLVVVSTATGSAQPVAAGLDRQEWSEVLGTIAGDDTVLVICADERQASAVRQRIEVLFG